MYLQLMYYFMCPYTSETRFILIHVALCIIVCVLIFSTCVLMYYFMCPYASETRFVLIHVSLCII